MEWINKGIIIFIKINSICEYNSTCLDIQQMNYNYWIDDCILDIILVNKNLNYFLAKNNYSIMDMQKLSMSQIGLIITLQHAQITNSEFMGKIEMEEHR